jgi:response regulator RpfG family c-di-GMP phosphodiesterase
MADISQQKTAHKCSPEDRLGFAGEEEGTLPLGRPLKPSSDEANCYKLLIVDDEQEVHTLTRLVLKNYEFEGRGLKLLSAYSGVGARQVLRDNPDVAVILLDVVMETEDSGLQLIRHIREELQDRKVRIILRTGQPGQAPELEVVAQYDINDYKAKTELTSQKLYTAVTSALRSWRDIQTIDRSRRGLRRVIDSSGPLFEGHSLKRFAEGVLDELMQLAGPGGAESPGKKATDTLSPAAAAKVDESGADAMAGQGDPVDSQVSRGISGLVALSRGGEFMITAGRGKYSGFQGRPVSSVVRDAAGSMVSRAGRMGCEFFFNNSFVSCIRGDEGQQILFLVRGGRHGIALDRDLIRIYMANVAMAYHNVNLSTEIIETQKEIIHTLGEVVETRSKETANHVLRVGKMAELLALRVGLSEEEATVLRVAAPMHDVGKVGIPDAILNKPGALSEDEYETIKTHTTIGWEILGKSDRRIIKSAALVAHQHHEHWDGKGYPQQLQGEDIHIFGRITAIVDVFDAVINKRCYRDAKELSDVVGILRHGRGTHFDPELVDTFLAHLTEFVNIVKEHPDSEDPQAEEGTG